MQKFPFILDEIGAEHRGRRFAIVIDEAYSSQGGRTSAAVSMALSAARIQLSDADAEIEPVPTTGGGRKPEPELDRLSNILKAFNDQFGNIPGIAGKVSRRSCTSRKTRAG